MSIGIGVIGAGVMGADHARTIATAVGGAHLVAIADADGARAADVAAALGARSFDDGMALIADPAVDAVLVASPDATHADFVRACLAAGRNVLCEKPLAPTAAACEAVMAAEMAGGVRRVQVGFMRRFDPGYTALQRRLAAGEVGAPVMLHCVHRNATVPAFFDSDMVITNAAVHELDIARWLLGREIVAASVFAPAAPDAPPGAVRDRQLLVLEMSGGVLVDIEVFVSAGYGYDVRAELVGTQGTLSLAPQAPVALRAGGRMAQAIAADWRDHFAAAYRLQLQAWVQAIRTGTPCGASAWDGYAATVIAQACIEARLAGARVPVALPPRPAFYEPARSLSAA